MEMNGAAKSNQPSRGQQLTVAVVLLLIAFGMRTYQLAEVPPGMMHSELLQLRVADVVHAGELRMLYNPGYGNEPFYYPVLAASESILGPNPLGRRLPSVFAGMLGLCLVYALAKRTLGWRIAVIALGASAVIWWSLVMQRIMLRQVLVMPLYALALYTWWRGYEDATRTNRSAWRFFIVAGIAFGVAQYVHTIPRGLVAAVGLFGLYLLLFHRPFFKRVWRGLLAVVLISEIIAAPMLIYANQHLVEDNLPQLDLAQPNGAAEFISRLPATASRVVGQFFWAGEGEDAIDYDIPYRPIFEPIGAVLFGLGLIVALWRWRRPVYSYLLIAWAIVLVPSILFNADILFSRLVSAQATTYLFLGVGIETVVAGLRRIAGKRTHFVLVTAGLIGLFLFYLVGTAHDMFIVWPSLKSAQWSYNTDMRDLGRYLDAQTQPVPAVSACTLMIWPQYHDSLSQLGAPYFMQRRDVQLRWHDCRYSMVIPAGGQYLYAYPTIEPLSAFVGRTVKTPWLDDQYAQPVEGLNAALQVDVRSALAGKLAEWQKLPVAWPPEATVSSTAQLPVDFNHSLDLIGYSIQPSTVKPGKNVQVQTVWRVTGPVPDDLILFTHLYRTPSEVMAQEDRLDVVGSSLKPGDVFIQQHEFIEVPPNTPGGSYWVGIGAYHKDTGERWPIYQGDQRAADRLFLKQVQVTP